jgi:chromosome partitioning protein
MMPTIVFVSPKGGAGKTTAALLLATQLASSYDVTMIDADPNRPIKSWAAGGNAPRRLSVVSDVDEDNIIERIEEAAAKTPIVIVDLEGTAAKIVVLAVSQADLALIPIQGSQLDAEQASRAIKVIKQREKMTGRGLPYAVLLTRTNPAIRTRTMSHIQNGLIEAGVPVLETELHDREAFRAVFSFRQPLSGLDSSDVANLDKAQANVEEFALEILRGLASVAAKSKAGEGVV